jgi:hypothetical protein
MTLTSDPFIEKNLELLIDAVDELAGEQSKLAKSVEHFRFAVVSESLFRVRFAHQISRQQQQQQQWLARRVKNKNNNPSSRNKSSLVYDHDDA